MSATQRAADPLFLAFQLAVAGRYSIDRELGRGGMGIVYLAREVHLDRLVAIKLLPPDKALVGSLRERFLGEARLAAKLSHPHIIPIHAVDEAGGFVFFVMSYVDGETLTQRVRSRGPLSASDGTRVLREAAWALGYAHNHGLVHRDVKPDNILIEGATGRALVADFGIAAAVGKTSDSGISGTPEFMSPEQALGEEVDARSDIYGLGVTAFYAFSGQYPFDGHSATEILAKQVAQPAPPLASMGMGVPRKLASLVDRCLAKEPAQRPANASVLAEQLGVAMEQRKELPAALRAFVRRNGRMDGTGTLLYSVALLSMSIGAAAWLGPLSGFLTLAAGALVAPLAFAVGAARQLTRFGFAHADLAPAFRSEIETAREERVVEHGIGRSAAEKVLGWLTRVSASYSAVVSPFILGGLATRRWHDLATLAMPITGVMLATAFAAGTGYLAVMQRRRDIDTEFWSHFWHGRVGMLGFRIVKRLRGAQPVNAAMTHRATELSLGMAAEQLYEALPKDVRGSIGDLPAILGRLQRDAQALRSRYEDLNDALTRVSTINAPDVYASLTTDRDTIHEKLRETVAALETIRLNLLRLHAGAATVDGLTTHLGIARNVSEEVERLIAARNEVEAQFPREAAATPV